MSTVLILDDPTTVNPDGTPLYDVIVADNLAAGALTDDGFMTTDGDADADLGVVSFSGPVGSFQAFVSVGLADPALPVGKIDLDTLFLSNSAGVLEFMFTTTDVDLGTGIAQAMFNFGGNTDGTTTAQATVDPDGREFGIGGNPQTVGTLGPFSSLGFSDTITTPVPVSNDSSLTISGDVTASGALQKTSFDAELVVEVPDVPLAMLGDFVWEDLNANGIQDPDELDDGINGVEVKLLADIDGDGEIDDVVATQLTANNPVTDLPGWYKFNGLTPGVEYQVMFNNPDPDGPDAYMFSPRQVGADPNVDSDGPMSDVVVLSSGEFNDSIDAGLFRKGSIHVFGYEDMDGDGNFDPEDGAFPDDPGKTFELLDENGDVIETQTTMDGMVWFEQLTPGTYSVRENPIPDGFDLTTLPNERTFTIISGEELVYADGAAMLPAGDQRFETNLGDDLRWGNTELAMLGDFVWEDLNANGIQDPDELDDGINGVEVKLLADTNDDGTPDTVVDTQFTTNNPDGGLAGWYKFNGLTPGVEYQVMFNNPDPDGDDAYMFSPRQVGGDPAVDSDGPMSDVVVLSSGEFNDTIDAGLFRKGSIHVFGFLDKDGDGIQDGDEGAFPDDPGKTFELLDENGDVIMTDSTMDGMVWFEQLTPGTYTVRENPIPDGFALTTLPNQRTFTIISGQELVYEDGAAMLPEGDQRFETNLGDDLRWGNTELAMLGDFVWEDLNANGIQDANELDDGINGVEVKLLADTDNDGQIDDVVATQLTTNNPDTNLPGWYKFNGLTPGVEYQVMFNNPDPDGPDAYMFSPRQVGGDPAIDSDGPMSDVVVLSSGEFNDTIDAGLFRKGSIHVFGFLDEDGDGIQDGDEGAFPDNPGKTFELLDENGDFIASDTTESGMVWFEQLTPGTYTVRENPVPDGFDLTTLPNERTFTIISGEELVYEDGAAMLPEGDQRFETNLGDDLRWGNTELAMLGDFVWEDLNANGIQDADELDDGINGVEVKLLEDTDNDGIPETVVDDQLTSNNPDSNLPGWYKFNGLTPGVAYSVMFNNPDPDGPDAYMFSPRQVGADPAVDSDGPMSDAVVLSSGEFNDTIDAGLFRKGSIHVFGYDDKDGDGNFDPEDEAFPDDPGKTFELLDENGDVIMTDSTMDGMVWFEQLTPGTYTVRENPVPDGFELTTLPNERTFTIISGEELVYEDGAAMLPDGDQRFETNLGDDLRWGNFRPEPEVDLEKFVRVDINPIDIEKLVRVETPGHVGDVCDVYGKPVELTFEYIPGTDVITDQDDASATGTPDDDGKSFIVVTDRNKVSDVLAGEGNVYFSDDVLFDEEFTASAAEAGEDRLKSNTFIYVFDDLAAFNAGNNPLQTLRYHTSCSQPIQLGDVIGSVTLVDYVGEDGAVEQPDLGPGIGDDDADLPTGPSATPGDTVVFTYVVTNPIPDTQLADVVVTDQLLAPDENDLPDPTPVEDGGFNVGDTDMDNELDFGEVWLYTSTVDITSATTPAQYTDKATVVGTPVDDNGDPIGGQAMDMDPANFVVSEEPPFQGDVCETLGKPVELTFDYVVGTTVDTDQDSSKAEIFFQGGVDDDGVSFIVVSDRSTASDALGNDGKQFFRGNVAFDETFTASETFDNDDFGSTTYIHFFDDSTGGLLQSIVYHTSCSQPIRLGDVIGNATLVGYDGEDGSAALPPPSEDSGGANGDGDALGDIMLEVDDPFDPNNIGEDADDPTGPIAELGNKITFTYKVTNTGNVDLTITSLFDDNETPPLPPGTGDDDFEPAPVLKDNGNNFGDDNDDGLLNPGEMWFFQAMELATDPGQHTNIAKVTAEDDAGTMVMDDDPANYLVNPLNIVKLVAVDAGGDGQDLCFDEDGNKIGKPEAMTFLYDAAVNQIDTNQAPGKVVYVDGFDDSDGDGNSFILVTDKEDASADDARVFFSGNVTSGMTYTASSIIDGTEKDFKGSTYIHIFDEADREELLQSVEFHTSCSQPLTPGDQYGSSQLVGGVLADGTVVDPQPVFEDANEAPGPEALVGSEVLFRYEVTNTGDTAVANVDVTDDNRTPDDPSDDFNPDPILSDDGFNIGDTNQDNLLDPDEEWLYTASETAEAGLQTNKGTVTGTIGETELMDMDPANYTGVETPPFEGDVCDAFGKPVALTFDYEPGSDVDTGQEDASATGTPDGDGESFIVVTDRNKVSDVLDGEGKIYFSGIVLDDEEFTASAAEAGDDRLKSNTFIYVFGDEDAFDAGNDPLQIMRYHTSCSQPIELGDVIGSVELVGYHGEDGSVEDMNLFG